MLNRVRDAGVLDGEEHYSAAMADPTIAESLAAQRRRIAEACARVGRDPESVRLLAVSKTKPAAAIREAYAAGQRDFGENYVQELVQKSEELADLPELRFHLIGHLQRNKVRKIAGLVSAVHSIDSVRLTEELDRRLEGRELPARRHLPAPTAPEGAGSSGGLAFDSSRLPVFVEVNVGGEAAKSGCTPEDLAAVLDSIDASSHLRAVGLMTIPPHTDEPAEARPFFERLSELRDRHGGDARLPELSMGMSQDLEIAVASGATWVRVGTALFGARAPREQS